ncbi:MAG TPA: LytR C-terminal domain-containing protein [Acidimicrobiales bacterium]|nr:LytR C-terminal domain-containing protein [Acidimicrobiales bacterium]
MSGDSSSPRDGHAAGSHYQPPLPVVLVIVLLFVGGTFLMVRSVSPASSSSATTTTTLTTSTTTPASTRVIKSRVRVQVANGTNVTALAATYTQRLMTQDWDTLPPVNGPAEAKTVIYYRVGQVRAAREIATEIGVSQSSLRPLGHLTSVAGAQGDDVVVVLGNNSAPK